MQKIVNSWRSFLTEGVTITYNIEKHLNPAQLEAIKDWAGLSGDAKHLGTASMGSAYKFGDKVLKITRDYSEAAASVLLMGKEHPNVYNIYNVGRIPEINRFAIVSEFLGPSDEEMRIAAKGMYRSVAMRDVYYNWNGIEALEPDKLQVLNALASYAPEGGSEEKLKEYVSQIATGLTYLKRNGIIFSDLKPGNVMNKDGQAAIIDVGRSYVKEYVDIPTIMM